MPQTGLEVSTKHLNTARLDSPLLTAAFSVSLESMQLEINVETLLPTAEGSSGIVLEVGGREIASPLPSFRSRRRGTLEEDACEPWPEMRAVCQDDPTL